MKMTTSYNSDKNNVQLTKQSRRKNGNSVAFGKRPMCGQLHNITSLSNENWSRTKDLYINVI